jgi:hypothetical protein
MIFGHSSTWNHPCASFFSRFNLNKRFSHKLGFILFCDILSSQCAVVWFSVFVRCSCDFLFWYGVRLPVLLRCSFGSNWQINFDQLLIQPMTRSSTMQIRRHENFNYFYFATLFVGLRMLFYAINLDASSLFADSFFFIFSDVEFLL